MSNMIQPAIRLIAMVIFLGYMMIWVMMPTNTFWLHWLPRIHSATDSTFLGQQGGNILVYTAPILLIAALACIYLHLENKPSYHSSNQR
ncbi:putative ferric-chelate reductase (NADH) [Helianthus debilis subsp. tardiflorus]